MIGYVCLVKPKPNTMQILIKKIAVQADIDEGKAMQALLVVCAHVTAQYPPFQECVDSILGTKETSFINETYVVSVPSKTELQ